MESEGNEIKAKQGSKKDRTLMTLVAHLDFTPIIVSSWYSVCSTLISFSLSHCFKVPVEKKQHMLLYSRPPGARLPFLLEHIALKLQISKTFISPEVSCS